MNESDRNAAPNDPERVVDALYRVNDFLAHVHDLHTLLEAIMEESKAVVDAEASSCLLYDEDSDELFFEVALGEKGEEVKEIRLPMGTGIAGECASSRKTIVVADVSSDERHYKQADEHAQFQTRNLLATPMVRNNQLIGVLEVLNKSEGRDFSDDDVQIIEFFAGQAAIAIENALLIQKNIQAERLAAIGQAIAGISHYAKNILMGLSGSISLIDIALSQDNMKIISQAWPILKRNNQKISSLVQDMLTYSKDREPEYAAGHLNSVVTEAVQLCQDSAAESKVELVLELDDAMPLSAFEVGKISDAVLNLIGNAIDATRDTENARVGAGTRFIPESEGAKGPLMEVIVTDNGPGMSPQVQRKIFDAFFSTKGGKGTGLGLAVTRKIVEEHGGRLTVDSEEGQGATFTLMLPARSPETASLIG